QSPRRRRRRTLAAGGDARSVPELPALLRARSSATQLPTPHPHRPTSPDPRRDMWSIPPMRHRCPPGDAPGRASRCTTCTATWSDGAAVRSQSAHISRGARRSTIKPGGCSTRRVFVCRNRAAITPADLVLRRLSLHVVEHGGGGPAIDLEPVRLLIRAQGRAREHTRLAVDLVLVEAELGKRTLHRLDLRGAQLRVLAPRRLERTRVADALAQMADEQHVQIRKIVFLDDVVILEREKRRSVSALGQEQRRGLVELGRSGLAAICERKSLLEPFAERASDLGHANGAVHTLRRVHLVSPARSALPTLADELLRCG